MVNESIHGELISSMARHTVKEQALDATSALHQSRQ